MFIHNKFVYYLCILMAVVLSSSTFAAMGDYDDDEVLNPAYSKYPKSNVSVNNLDRRASDSSDSQLMAPATQSATALTEPETSTLANLQQYFNPTILNVRVPATVKKILGGAGGVLASFPSFQVPVPLFFAAAGEVGLTPERLPFSVPLVMAVGALPVTTGIVAAYDATTSALTYRSPELIEAQTKVTNREYSRLESWVYSPAKKFYQLPIVRTYQFLFYGGLMAAIITNLESNVTGWGPYEIWAACFGVLFLLPMYYMYVDSTNKPNENPFRHYETDTDKKAHQELVQVVKTVREEVKDNGLQNTGALANKMNVLFAEQSSQAGEYSPLLSSSSVERLSGDTPQDAASLTDAPVAPTRRALGLPDSRENSLSTDSSDTSLGRPEDIPSDVHVRKTSDIELGLQTHRMRFLKVFDEIAKIYHKIPAVKKKWNEGKEKLALGGSIGDQTLSIPMRTLLTCGLIYKPLSLFLPAGYAMGGSIALTVIFTPLNLLCTYKDIPLTRDECVDLSGLYPPDSPPYWGARIASGIAMVGATTYIVLPIEYYLRHNILEDVFNITNLPVQILLTAPFLAGTIYAGARQFISKQMSKISNWASTGMEIDFCCRFRIFPCCDSRNALTSGQELLDKITEIYIKTQNLNPSSASVLHNELNMNPVRSLSLGSL